MITKGIKFIEENEGKWGLPRPMNRKHFIDELIKDELIKEGKDEDHEFNDST